MLEEISNNLAALRSEVDSTTNAHVGKSNKSAFVREQDMQYRWGNLFNEKYEALKQVQTGIMLGQLFRNNHHETDIQQAQDISESTRTNTSPSDQQLAVRDSRSHELRNEHEERHVVHEERRSGTEQDAMSMTEELAQLTF